MKRGKAKYFRRNKAKCVYFYNYRRKQKELKLLKMKRDELNKKFEEGQRLIWTVARELADLKRMMGIIPDQLPSK